MGVQGLFWCVFVLVGVSAESFSSEEEKIVKSVKNSEPKVFYIYPRSGRLFHADYVRDNEIFRSLERTNFMRRGTFLGEEKLRRTKREEDEESTVKKYTYVDAGRIPGEKKSVLGNVRAISVKDTAAVSGFTKTNSNINDKRSKREIIRLEKDDAKKDKVVLPQNKEPSNDSSYKQKVDEEAILVKKKEDQLESASVVPINCTVTKDEEKIVEGELSTHPKNNDTDKTLFVQDSLQEKYSFVVEVPEAKTVKEEGSSTTVLSDRLRLYPVYRGVKYTYPRVERSLLYAPEMTVQMDNPEIKEYVNRSQNMTKAALEEEGRGRRRRIKKLVFPLLLALKLKALVLLPLLLGVVSLVAFKGLWSGLTALGVAGALGLKALVGAGPRVVVQAPSAPHYHHLPPHDYEYWSRRDDFNDYRPSSWS